LVVDDALPLEGRRVLGEEAGLIDGEGDFGFNLALAQKTFIRGPDLEVLHAMSGSRVHKSRACILGDVLAGEQRHIKEIIVVAAKWMRAHRIAKHFAL